MRVHRPLRDAVLTAAVTCSALTVLTGCRGESARSDTPVSASASDMVVGPSQGLGNGNARTYVTLDGDGRPTEVGVRLSSTALEGLPQSGTMLMLDFPDQARSEEHTSELQSRQYLVCRLLLEKKKQSSNMITLV